MNHKDLENLGVTVETLYNTFVDAAFLNWRRKVIISVEMRDGTRFIEVKCGDSYLRYSKGPGTGTFWDTYPNNFLTPSLAFKAIINSEPPPYMICGDVS